MKRTKLLWILGVLAVTALIFTGCKDENPEGSDNPSNSSNYVAVTSLNISSSGGNVLDKDDTRTLTATANTGVHSSLTITWTTNSNLIVFIVGGNETNQATGASVTVKAKTASVTTNVTVTATAVTTDPDTGLEATKTANRYLEVNETQVNFNPTTSTMFTFENGGVMGTAAIPAGNNDGARGPAVSGSLTMTFPQVSQFRWAPQQNSGNGRIATNGAAARDPLATIENIQGPFRVTVIFNQTDAANAFTAHINLGTSLASSVKSQLSPGTTSNMELSYVYEGSDAKTVSFSGEGNNFAIRSVKVEQ